MSRPLRIDYPGAFHHVMNRGADKDRIFLIDADRQVFLSTLADAVRLWGIRIHAYALMDNHYHLLVETPLANLSRAMRHIDGIYTQRFNWMHSSDGPLMRGRFKSILIERESYFLELIRYIHLNGVRAGLYPEAGRDPHSSHRGYMAPSIRPGWLTTHLALSYFGGDDPQGRQSLDGFVRAGMEMDGAVTSVLSGNRWPAVLGGQEFITLIKKQFIEGQARQPEKPQEKDLRRNFSADEILKQVATAYGVGLENLINRTPGKRNEAKRAAIYLLRHAGQLPYSTIGGLLGGLRHGHVSRVCLGEIDKQDDRLRDLIRVFLNEEYLKPG